MDDLAVIEINTSMTYVSKLVGCVCRCTGCVDDDDDDDDYHMLIVCNIVISFSDYTHLHDKMIKR